MNLTYLLFLIYMSEYFDDCQCVHVYMIYMSEYFDDCQCVHVYMIYMSEYFDDCQCVHVYMIYMSEYFDDCQCVHVYIHACACVARMAFVLFVLCPLTLIPFSSVCLGITVKVLLS